MNPVFGPTPSDNRVGPTRVFVYGTLRPGGVFWFRALAGRVSGVSPTVRIGGLHMVSGPGYPLAVRASGQGAPEQGSPPSGVVGEVVDIPTPLAVAVLADLDRIEGVPHLFERTTIDGSWVYVAAAGITGGSVVASGDWFDVTPMARHAWQVEMGRGYTGA